MSKRTLPVVLFVLILYTVGLGNRGLNEPDEGRYVSMALEMLEPYHNVLVPTFSELGHFDKPPLIYWATAASLRLFGQNEFAARMPSLLGALLSLLGIYWAAFRLYDRATAERAFVVAATLPHLWVCAHLISPDMFFTGWITLAIAAWAETRHRNGDIRFWLVQVVFWTLAWYTKATPLFIPLTGLILFTLLSKNPADRQALRPIRLLCCIIALGLPWYLYLVNLNPELWDFFLKREIVGRVAGHVDGRKKFIGFHFVIAALLWLPWWPYAMRRLWARRPRLPRTFATIGPEPVIVLLGLILFSFVSSKLLTYTLPLAPWAALAIARSLPPRLPRLPVLLSTVLFTGILIAAPRYETKLGRNSSLRITVHALEKQGATQIISFRHLSSLEFYFGENVHYLDDSPPVQVASDLANLQLHFLSNAIPAALKTPQTWVLYLKRDENKLAQWGIILPPPEQIQLFGDIRAFPLVAEEGV